MIIAWLTAKFHNFHHTNKISYHDFYAIILFTSGNNSNHKWWKNETYLMHKCTRVEDLTWDYVQLPTCFSFWDRSNTSHIKNKNSFADANATEKCKQSGNWSLIVWSYLHWSKIKVWIPGRSSKLLINTFFFIYWYVSQ